MNYILQKDTKTSKAGEIFLCFGDEYADLTYLQFFTKEFVENNPEWFLPVEVKEFTKQDILNAMNFMLIHAIQFTQISEMGGIRKDFDLRDYYEGWLATKIK